MTTVLSTKGQIVIPAALRIRKSLRPGDRLNIEETQEGILIRKADRRKPKIVEKGGLLVFQGDEDSPRITSAMVKQLESELT